MIAKSKPKTVDPLELAKVLWPKLRIYPKQKDILYSVLENDLTVVPAGNMLGKDFIAGFIVLTFFLTRQPCRIVTTSAKDDHLSVLWGEIHNFIQMSEFPLNYKEGGNLIINQREIKKFYNGKECPKSYIKGMVASDLTIAALQGHHVAKTGDGVPRTLYVIDEASSVKDGYFEKGSTWANRILVIGNTWPCNNFFFRSVEGDPATKDPGGDIPRDNGKGYHRKVIHISAEESPNVQYAKKELAAGKEPSGKILLPGVKDWEEYQKNLKVWDPIQQEICLNARFYKGEEVKLYPEEWRIKADEIYQWNIENLQNRKAKVLAVDGGEGWSNTCWTIIDEHGIIKKKSKKTPDTSEITEETIRLGNLYGIPATDWYFDRGGGGKQHADRLRKEGYRVKTIFFGDAASDPNKFYRQKRSRPKREAVSEIQTIYKNRRAEMYGLLRFYYLDPINHVTDELGNYRGGGFGIPMNYTELQEELNVMPLKYDSEGKLYLPPKDKVNENSKEETIKEMLGRSPDHADSLVMAIFGLHRKQKKIRLGA